MPTLIPSLRSRDPAVCVASQLFTVTSFPSESLAVTLLPPPLSLGGTKNERYGTARPRTLTPTDPARMRFMAVRRFMSGTKTSSLASIFTSLVAGLVEVEILGISGGHGAGGDVRRWR